MVNAEEQAERAEQESDHEELVSIDAAAQEGHVRKIGQLEGSFAANAFTSGLGQGGGAAQKKER